ncbi:MAG: DUF4173 domain-containing protein [Christensenellaceae bacterium]|jgi:hypothetical protein|nr:DUF4173 domain-containing protein [Christensenellaceae bacterium]
MHEGTTQPHNGLDTPAQPQNAAPRAYSGLQRWLLLITLAIGYIFAFVVLERVEHADSIRAFSPAYALFWCVYLAGYYACLWRKAVTKWESWVLLGSVLLLFLHFALYHERVLSLMNLLFIPLLLMLHAVVGAFDVPYKAEGAYVVHYALGWVYFPFCAIGRWFGAIGSLFAKGEDQRKSARRSIWMGILCGLPVCIVVFALLLQADAAMRAWFAGWLSFLPDISFGRILLLLVLAALFYSFLYNLCWGEGHKTAVPAKGERLPAPSLMAVMGMLLFAYAVFIAFQFTYLTGLKGLPSGLTYSEYAVHGFEQLLWVTCINLIVFGIALKESKPHAALKPMLFALLAATALVLASAMVRLGMYVNAYALTWKRVLSAWLMLYFCIALLLCAIRLAKPRLPLLRILALGLICWYVALNLVNVEGMIAHSIFRRAQAKGGRLEEADAAYIRYNLSRDARADELSAAYGIRVPPEEAP